jgi:mono/diheme cytochrome c family protein
LQPPGGGAKLRRMRAPALLSLLALAACEPAEPPAPAGQETFLRYCASCHGADGTGSGPMAQHLKRLPSDLTQIAKRNGGRFDEHQVMAFIDGRRVIPEHGTREMPVWGAEFEKEHEGERYGSYISLLQTRLLVDYLRSIQEK